MSETSHFIVTDFAKRVYIFTECDVNMVIESNIRPKQVKQMRISSKRCINYQEAIVRIFIVFKAFYLSLSIRTSLLRVQKKRLLRQLLRIQQSSKSSRLSTRSQSPVQRKRMTKEQNRIERKPLCV